MSLPIVDISLGCKEVTKLRAEDQPEAIQALARSWKNQGPRIAIVAQSSRMEDIKEIAGKVLLEIGRYYLSCRSTVESTFQISSLLNVTAEKCPNIFEKLIGQIADEEFLEQSIDKSEKILTEGLDPKIKTLFLKKLVPVLVAKEKRKIDEERGLGAIIEFINNVTTGNDNLDQELILLCSPELSSTERFRSAFQQLTSLSPQELQREITPQVRSLESASIRSILPLTQEGEEKKVREVAKQVLLAIEEYHLSWHRLNRDAISATNGLVIGTILETTVQKYPELFTQLIDKIVQESKKENSFYICEMSVHYISDPKVKTAILKKLAQALVKEARGKKDEARRLQEITAFTSRVEIFKVKNPLLGLSKEEKEETIRIRKDLANDCLPRTAI